MGLLAETLASPVHAATVGHGSGCGRWIRTALQAVEPTRPDQHLPDAVAPSRPDAPAAASDQPPKVDNSHAGQPQAALQPGAHETTRTLLPDAGEQQVPQHRVDELAPTAPPLGEGPPLKQGQEASPPVADAASPMEIPDTSRPAEEQHEGAPTETEELSSKQPPLPKVERHPTQEMLDAPLPGTEAALRLHAAEKDKRHVAEMKKQEMINQRELQEHANKAARHPHEDHAEKTPVQADASKAMQQIEKMAQDAQKRFNDIKTFMDATTADRKKLDAVMLEDMERLKPLCEQYTHQRAELLTLAAPQCSAAQGRVNALDWSSDLVRGKIGKHCVPDRPAGTPGPEKPALRLTPAQCDFKSHQLLCQDRLMGMKHGAPSPTYVKPEKGFGAAVATVPLSMDEQVRQWCHPFYDLGPGQITLALANGERLE
mmetsp:Transcript_26804/g.61805  ORF Transcript_26804/g.61805 Transcript_26804/m.61805 type:complete len:429 (+) Transcript_26804:73-1359(+)